MSGEMTDRSRTALAAVENTLVKESATARPSVNVTTFKLFKQKFLRELSSRHFGGDVYSVDRYSKTAGARELERTGAKDILSSDDVLHRIHQRLRDYARLLKEQEKVQQVSAEMGTLIKRLRDAEKTLQQIQKNIKALDKRLENILTVPCRTHLDKAVTELRFVEDVLWDWETTQSSHIHPALRQKHDKESGKSKYEVSQFRSLLPKFDYELDSLKKKAPQQWLLKKLDSDLRRRFKRANPKVPDTTRHRVIAAILKSGGVPPISANTIKEHFIEKRKPAKAPARNSQAT